MIIVANVVAVAMVGGVVNLSSSLKMCVISHFQAAFFGFQSDMQPEKHRTTQKSNKKPCYNARFF